VKTSEPALSPHQVPAPTAPETRNLSSRLPFFVAQSQPLMLWSRPAKPRHGMKRRSFLEADEMGCTCSHASLTDVAKMQRGGDASFWSTSYKPPGWYRRRLAHLQERIVYQKTKKNTTIKGHLVSTSLSLATTRTKRLFLGRMRCEISRL
jgi:hypothetical protein